MPNIKDSQGNMSTSHLRATETRRTLSCPAHLGEQALSWLAHSKIWQSSCSWLPIVASMLPCCLCIECHCLCSLLACCHSCHPHCTFHADINPRLISMSSGYLNSMSILNKSFENRVQNDKQARAWQRLQEQSWLLATYNPKTELQAELPIRA